MKGLQLTSKLHMSPMINTDKEYGGVQAIFLLNVFDGIWSRLYFYYQCEDKLFWSPASVFAWHLLLRRTLRLPKLCAARAKCMSCTPELSSTAIALAKVVRSGVLQHHNFTEQVYTKFNRMSLLKKIKPFIRSNEDTGFGVNAESYGGRFVNKDGSFNLRKEGLPVWDRYSMFHSMLNMPRWKFIAVIIIFFICINLLYTIVYVLIGAHQFTGMIAGTKWQQYKELYFFSTETFTTVGYGRVNPIGDTANFVASIEAMTGFLSFAIATGLIFGRFSKPTAYLLFSEKALIAPFQNVTGLMFRFVSYKENHNLTNIEVKVSLSILAQENEKSIYKFYDLPLERNHVDSLPMNFTVVHPIDDNSPLQGFGAEDMKTADMEVYVLVRAFDDVYSNTVLQRTSYTYDEVVFNAKFVQMYRESADGKTTIIELDKLNVYKEL